MRKLQKFDIESYRAKKVAESPECAEACAVTAVIGELLVLRFKWGLTQAEIADRIGVPQPRVAEFEAMDGRRVSLEFAVKYARALGAQLRVVPPKKAAKTGKVASAKGSGGATAYVAEPR